MSSEDQTVVARWCTQTGRPDAFHREACPPLLFHTPPPASASLRQPPPGKLETNLPVTHKPRSVYFRLASGSPFFFFGFVFFLISPPAAPARGREGRGKKTKDQVIRAGHTKKQSIQVHTGCYQHAARSKQRRQQAKPGTNPSSEPTRNSSGSPSPNLTGGVVCVGLGCQVTDHARSQYWGCPTHLHTAWRQKASSRGLHHAQEQA